MAELAFDPQTSGGLLIACEASGAEALLASIQRDDENARIIGTVTKRGEGVKNAVMLK
jgi:hydrogenase maturation factor